MLRCLMLLVFTTTASAADPKPLEASVNPKPLRAFCAECNQTAAPVAPLSASQVGGQRVLAGRVVGLRERIAVRWAARRAYR